MSFTIAVEDGNTIDQVAKLFADYGPKVMDQARVKATNDMMQIGRTQIRKEIRADTGVSAKELNKRMKLSRAKRGKKVARLFVGTMPVAAIKLNARQLRRGVSYRGPAGRVSVQGAFIQTMPSGHTGVFKRRRPERLPIDEQRVAIAPAAVRAARKFRAVTIPREFPRIFERELSFRTNREIAKRGIR